MANRSAVVHVSVLGIQHRLWCSGCSLSAGVTIWYAVNGDLRSKSECADCGGSDIVPDSRAEWL